MRSNKSNFAYIVKKHDWCNIHESSMICKGCCGQCLDEIEKAQDIQEDTALSNLLSLRSIEYAHTSQWISEEEYGYLMTENDIPILDMTDLSRLREIGHHIESEQMNEARLLLLKLNNEDKEE